MTFFDRNVGWHPSMLVLLLVGMLLFWTLIIREAVFLFRVSRSGGQSSRQPGQAQILEERFTRVGIDPEELRRLQALVGSKEYGAILLC